MPSAPIAVSDGRQEPGPFLTTAVISSSSRRRARSGKPRTVDIHNLRVKRACRVRVRGPSDDREPGCSCSIFVRENEALSQSRRTRLHESNLVLLRVGPQDPCDLFHLPDRRLAAIAVFGTETDW